MIRWVLFDAVGAVLFAQPSVQLVYQRCGRPHGADVSESVLSSRIEAALVNHFTRSDVPTSEALEKSRWREFVASVFPEVVPIDSLFEDLWQHFASPASWQTYDDVSAVWTKLHKRNVSIGIASNFDARLERIVAGDPVLRQCDRLFISSQIGWAKPSVAFYRSIERELNVSPSEILMIGDDFENDVAAPRRCGWHAIWLDRPRMTLADLPIAIPGDKTR